MDPLSVTAACAGILGSLAGLSLKINSLVCAVRSARRDMDAVSREISSLSLCLETLHDDCSGNILEHPPQLKQSLVALLKNCDTVAKDMDKVLESTLKSKLGAGFSWSTSGSSEMDKLRVRLEAHKASLEIALEMVSMFLIRDVKEDTAELKRLSAAIKTDTEQIPGIKQDTSQISILVQEITSLRLQVSNLEQRGDNVVLQRFLAESTTYAESAYDAAGQLYSPSGSPSLEPTIPEILENDAPEQELRPSSGDIAAEECRKGDLDEQTQDKAIYDLGTGLAREQSEPPMSWDLIEHFKLDAQIYGDYTLHTEYVSDLARGMRKARVEKRWYKERHIRHGAFGDVWLEVQKERDRVTAKRAVKSIQKRRMESVKIDYKRELLALAKLSRHQELFVTLRGWYENNDCVFLAMEYFPYGDLEDYITRGITEDGAKMICAQLLDGLSLMHSIGFTHRDLKPQNIFIVSTVPQWWVKIGDFGISKRIATEQTALRTQAGTQQFQAPEILGYVEAEETSEYTNAVDMWSLGCVTYLMLAQTMPFARPRALNKYCSGRVQFPSKKLRERGVSMDGLRFVEELLNPHPSQRLPAEPASQHAWLQLSLPAEDKKGKVQGHEYQVQDSGPLRQTRPTEQTLGAEIHVSGLEQEQLQYQPENCASSERAMSADEKSSISLTSLQTTLPVAVQGEQAVDFPTKISPAPPSAIRPSPLPQSTCIVSTTDSVTKVPATRNSSSISSSPQPDLTNTLRPNRRRDHQPPRDYSIRHITLEEVQGQARTLRKVTSHLGELKGHGGWVDSVAFSPDGANIASSSEFNSVTIWDVATGRQLRELKGHEGWVRSVVFSPDGANIASSSDDKSVRIWDATTGRQLREFKGHRGSVMSVAFSPDGTAIASGSWDKSVRIWDAATGRQLRKLEGHGLWVSSVAFSPDGTTIASGSWDKSVRIWDVATGRQLRKLKGHGGWLMSGGWVMSVAFSPNGTTIASGSEFNSVTIWDAATGRKLRELKGHEGWVRSVAFSPNGVTIASSSDDKSVRIWDATTGRQLREFKGHRGSVMSVAFSPDGTAIASGSWDCSVRIWDAVDW